KDAAYYTAKFSAAMDHFAGTLELASSSGDSAILEVPRLRIESGSQVTALAGAGGTRVLRTVLDNAGSITVAQKTVLESTNAAARHGNRGTIDVQAGEFRVNLSAG